MSLGFLPLGQGCAGAALADGGDDDDDDGDDDDNDDDNDDDDDDDGDDDDLLVSICGGLPLPIMLQLKQLKSPLIHPPLETRETGLGTRPSR